LLSKGKTTTIEELIELLEQEYGSLEWQWGQEPVAVLVGTILSQNTSDVNSGRAFDSLIATFGSWEAIASAPVEHIARAIRLGGLSRIKAVRIKQILEEIEREQGRISLDFLEAMNMSEARGYLMHLPGVGPKTASCVLLFALGKPCLPVDTHVFRVAKRLGLIDSGVSIERAHTLLEQQVPASKMYQFHLHLIEHGRRICHARRPRCDDCVLEPVCPSSLARERAA
jgi:endonuclease-3